ncbi:hypothetical protein CMI47_08885 [Candidatus Pacearchaeota archaeon]|jgi:hypothetical protein|nr:hypothetical protein [Candidatus Pacearchaeota archaeon]|tara:strand:- start:303 stop:482 length:180 start_codon:yes stop_codon:yes gene_type:complete
MNIFCEHCKESSKEDNLDRFDINFFEKRIRWFCPLCKKMNMLDVNKNISQPYPKTRVKR